MSNVNLSVRKGDMSSEGTLVTVVPVTSSAETASFISAHPTVLLKPWCDGSPARERQHISGTLVRTPTF